MMSLEFDLILKCSESLKMIWKRELTFCGGTESRTRTGGWGIHRKIFTEHKKGYCEVRPYEEWIPPPLEVFRQRLLTPPGSLAGLSVLGQGLDEMTMKVKHI